MSDSALILLGAGGHAKVLADLINACGERILGVCDPQLAQSGASHWRELAILGDDRAVFGFEPNQVQLVNGLGGPGRNAVMQQFAAKGYRFATLVHPRAVIGSGVELGEGVQIMAGAIVQADTAIGAHCIINTGAQIDHDGRLGRDVHLAPSAVLAGDVTLGDGVFVGPGAVIGRGVTVGDRAVIGAGTTVLKSLPAKARALGNGRPV
ncbi:acetyltransferase [Saccharospirillum mangrovi]|uniref:acetyltransferase n=1 Tax=Saccharospirillum mangrovi TaxID=2161747 RepID=UPI000D3D7FCC|nr:acetyltransferase [Saccharospirillum mangrovi]